MQIHQLTADECLNVLRSTNLGRLACVRYKQPYIVPIYFDYFDDALYSFATVGRKIHWMRSNPHVSVEVDRILDQFNWTTVIVSGLYEELTKTEAHNEARERACRLFQRRPDWWFPAAAQLATADTRPPVVYRIQIEEITGRQAARDPARLPRLDAASAAATHWWTHVLRPLHRPPAEIR